MSPLLLLFLELSYARVIPLRNGKVSWGLYKIGYTPVLSKQKRVTWFLALERGAARALYTSKTRSSASAPRPRCLCSIPDNFFPFSKVILGRTAAPKMRACASTLFCKEIRRVHPALSLKFIAYPYLFTCCLLYTSPSPRDS